MFHLAFFNSIIDKHHHLHFFFQHYISNILLNEKVHALVFINYGIEKCTVKLEIRKCSTSKTL